MLRLLHFLTLLVLLPISLEAESFRLFFSANRQGEIEPCGCQTGQIGGLDRAAAFLEAARKTKLPHLMVDAGDSFFGFDQLSQYRKFQQIEKAKLIARAYKAMGIRFMAPGERDLAGGFVMLGELKKLSGTEFIVSNARGLPSLFKRSALVRLGSTKLGVVGLLEPATFAKHPQLKLFSPKQALKTEVSKLRKQGAQKILLLSHLGLDRDREVAKLGLVDIIVGSHSLDVLTTPQVVGRTLILQTDLEGKQVGQLDYNVKDLVKSKHTLVELDTSFEKKNSVSEMMEDYEKKIRDLAFAAKKPSHTEAVPNGYVAHPAVCKSCHQKQYDFWNNTTHSSAYLVLYAKNQHFNPECIACHSIGFKEKGGFSRIAHPIKFATSPFEIKKGEVFVEKLMAKVFESDTGKGALDSRVQPSRYAKLKKAYHLQVHQLETKGHLQQVFIGVQCEHCHGNRNGHPGRKDTLKKVVESSCRQCHKGNHDPMFNFKKDLAKVACPKM